KACRRSWSSRTRRRCSASPTGRRSSSAARWSTRERAPILPPTARCWRAISASPPPAPAAGAGIDPAPPPGTDDGMCPTSAGGTIRPSFCGCRRRGWRAFARGRLPLGAGSMKRTKPPFRADHVGSFLRPAALKEARAKREKGAISAAELKAVEDREIEKVVKKQEELGLQLASDGEFRRSWWHFDFLGMLDGVEIYEAEQGIQFRGVQTKAQGLRIVGKVGFSDHPMLAHFKFLKAHSKVTPKMTIPAPPVLHFRLAKDGIKKG